MKATGCAECDRKVTKVNSEGQCQWCEAEEAAIFQAAAKINAEKVVAAEKAAAQVTVAEKLAAAAGVPVFYAQRHPNMPAAMLGPAFEADQVAQKRDLEMWTSVARNINQDRFDEAVKALRS